MDSQNIFNFYCDESGVNNKQLNFMGIGGLLIPKDQKKTVVRTFRDIKKKHNYENAELKWRKVSKMTRQMYIDLIDAFFSNSHIKFYCIIVDKTKVDYSRYHNDDEELAFYKRYYFLLKKRLFGGNRYYIFLDKRNKKDKGRIFHLTNFLELESKFMGEPHFDLSKVEELESKNHTLIQIADFFTGAVCYSYNKSGNSVVKNEIIDYIAKKLNKVDLAFSSALNEDKFNIFRIHLDG